MKAKEDVPQPKTFKALLKESNLKHMDIAKSLNYTTNTLRSRKRNPAKLTVEEVLAISRLLKRTPSSVFRAIVHDIINTPYIDEVDEEDDDQD